MLIELTTMHNETILANPDFIVLVERLGGERPHTKVVLNNRELQVTESLEEIKALCNPVIETYSLGELQTPAQVGPSEFKSAEPEIAQAAAEAFVEEVEKQRKRK